MLVTTFRELELPLLTLFSTVPKLNHGVLTCAFRSRIALLCEFTHLRLTQVFRS